MGDIRMAASERLQKFLNENNMLHRIQLVALDIVNNSEAMIDRLLPMEGSEEDRAKMQDSLGLVRFVSIPFQIPLRITRIIWIKEQQLAGRFSVICQAAFEVLVEKKDQTMEFSTEKLRSISEKLLK